MLKFELENAKVSFDGNKVIIDCDATTMQKIMCNLCNLVPLSDLKVGESFMIADEKFIVLEHFQNGTTFVISADFVKTAPFGDTNNWYESPIREFLNQDYFEKIAKGVSCEMCRMERDLASLDGLYDYDVCIDNVSLLTIAEYAKYHKVLGLKSTYENPWWTITPLSTPSNGYGYVVCYVEDDGTVRSTGCGVDNGVRPVLTFKSSIFVSLA